MNGRLKESYAKAREELERLTREYYNQCEKIESKYGNVIDENVEKMLSETENLRESMKIHELEITVKNLEDELLAELIDRLQEEKMQHSALLIGADPRELEVLVFGRGVSILSIRRQLLELALRVA